jgi:hypothetical protein
MKPEEKQEISKIINELLNISISTGSSLMVLMKQPDEKLGAVYAARGDMEDSKKMFDGAFKRNSKFRKLSLWVTSLKSKHEIPKPPLDQYIAQGVTVFCGRCGSTASRKGFLGLFGPRTCDNPLCAKEHHFIKR